MKRISITHYREDSGLLATSHESEGRMIMQWVTWWGTGGVSLKVEHLNFHAMIVITSSSKSLIPVTTPVLI